MKIKKDWLPWWNSRERPQEWGGLQHPCCQPSHFFFLIKKMRFQFKFKINENENSWAWFYFVFLHFPFVSDFSISVPWYLDGSSWPGDDDVARFGRWTTRHVVAQGSDGDDVDGKLHPRGGVHGAHGDGGPEHVSLGKRERWVEIGREIYIGRDRQRERDRERER